MKHRILVVDDNLDYRLLVRLALHRRDDFEVVGEAGDALDAIELTRTLQPDVVLMDLLLPGMDSLTAVPLLREVAPMTKIIAVSAYPDHELWGRSPVARTLAYISKSVPASDLANELERWIAVSAVEAPDVEAAATLRLPSELQSARAARHFVEDTLEEWECGHLVDAVILLVSELVTNAVIHAHSEVDLTVHRLPARVRVEVVDRAEAFVKRRNAADHEHSGRGFALIEGLAAAWGIDMLAAGKKVWFEVERTPAT